MKKVIIVIALLSLLAGLTAACTPATPGVIKIGLIDNFTGPAAQWGLEHKTAFELWIDDVNNAGGLKVGNKSYPVELVAYDARLDPTLAAELGNRLVFEDKVTFVGLNFMLDKPNLPMLTEQKIITFSHNMEPLLRPEWPYLFLSIPEAYETASAVYRWLAAERPQLKRVAVVGADDPNVHTMMTSYESIFAETGMQLVSTTLYPTGATDLYPYVSPALKENPDVIETAVSPTETAAATVKAARELGYTGLIVVGGMLPKTMIEIAGVENAEGVVSYSGWEHDHKYSGAKPAERAYHDRYVAKFGNDTYLCGAYYNDLLLWQQAVEKAGTLDADKVAEALHTYEFESLWLKGRFYGEPRYGIPNRFPPPVWLTQLTGGELTTFAMVPPPDELYKYPGIEAAY